MKSHIRAKFDEAVLLKEASEFDAARKILLELYKWDSASPTLLAVLADVCWELGHFDEAISFFQQAVRFETKFRDDFSRYSIVFGSTIAPKMLLPK